jgi:hypothetical protein
VRHPLGKPIPWQDGACKKRGELGRSPSHRSIVPALPDIGAAFRAAFGVSGLQLSFATRRDSYGVGQTVTSARVGSRC